MLAHAAGAGNRRAAKAERFSGQPNCSIDVLGAPDLDQASSFASDLVGSRVEHDA
jgi:hypothetical protein